MGYCRGSERNLQRLKNVVAGWIHRHDVLKSMYAGTSEFPLEVVAAEAVSTAQTEAAYVSSSAPEDSGNM